jgi:hypothetical protein
MKTHAFEPDKLEPPTSVRNLLSREHLREPHRAATDVESVGVVPPSVHEVLRSPGGQLDAETRAFMEPRFGRDFSHVRLHTDAKAAESASAANALAYTVGPHVVFGAGKYTPAGHEGRRLLAHELAHVVQQTTTNSSVGTLSDKAAETEADHFSAKIAAGHTAQVQGHTRPGLMQRQDKNAPGETAKKIIEAAKDTSKTIEQRSIDAVNSIIKTYYDPALVDNVVYKEKLEDDPNFKGLMTSPVGTGKDIKGNITVVSAYFIENIDSFARRVLQVGHELQHVEQQRAGMGGGARKKEREFLAFHWEATQPEKAATGRMPHATRVSLIDEALRNYYCMPATDQKSHAAKKEELVKLRETEEKAGGNEHKEPPTECKKK